MDTSFLNDPAFKAAGWIAGPEIKRSYSPPIPTSGASEYFQAPPQSVGLSTPAGRDHDDDTGMVSGATGGPGSNDTIGPTVAAVKRRKRREQLEEDDSSDLSDESNDEAEMAPRPANSIRFAKMPVRARAESSPARKRSESSPLRSSSQQSQHSQHDGPSLFVTSPSKPPDSQRLRSGSLGAAEAVKVRARRDTGTTATSSEVSSEGDLDPGVFQRKRLNSNQAQRVGRSIGSRIKEEDSEQGEDRTDTELSQDGQESEADSEDDSLASGFSETMDPSPSWADVGRVNSSPLAALKPEPSPGPSPKKSKALPDGPQELPPARPISTIQPVSALAAAIKARNKKSNSPFEKFASFSGEGASDPLYVKIYVPSSSMDEDEALKLHLRKFSNNGAPVTVVEAIGYSLWRYAEEGVEPKLTAKQSNLNRWTMRMVEDGEVDFDFPALGRTMPISDFTSNNNRPMRGRLRDKPWDEFGLVEATEVQMRENEDLTPEFAGAVEQEDETVAESAEEKPPHAPKEPNLAGQTAVSSQPPAPMAAARTPQNPITASRLALGAYRKDSSNNLADMPTTSGPTATPRTGAPRKLTIHFHDLDGRPHAMPLDCTTDTYISEVFDQVCAKLNVDRGMYVLKVSGTTTVAPTDRTVEAMGPRRNSLDLVRRRFVGEGGVGLGGSPGSTSPNAPLLLTTTGTPKKQGNLYSKKGGGGAHPLAQQSDMYAGSSGAGAGLGINNFKRYNVMRKQPMSFTPSNPRVLILDGEYLYIMPGEAYGQQSSGKTNIVHFSSVVGCKVNRKHPKTFRVVVFREKESKRYDFEATSANQAGEIVGEIQRGISPFRSNLEEQGR